MKNEILYASDMEPITVLPITRTMHYYLAEHGQVRLAVLPSLQDILGKKSTDELLGRIVCIRAEYFFRLGVKHRFLITDDEEAALMLRSDFLPGQRSSLQEQNRQNYVRGFMRAMETLR